MGEAGTQGSQAVSNDNNTECTKSDAEHILGGAETTFTNVLTISIGSERKERGIGKGEKWEGNISHVGSCLTLRAGNDGKHKDEANEHHRIHTLRSNVSHDHRHGCTKKGSLYIHR